MKRMGIDPEMRLGEAMELYPQSFQMFRHIGMCCVHPDPDHLTVHELCTSPGVETNSFLDAANSII